MGSAVSYPCTPGASSRWRRRESNNNPCVPERSAAGAAEEEENAVAGAGENTDEEDDDAPRMRFWGFPAEKLRTSSILRWPSEDHYGASLRRAAAAVPLSSGDDSSSMYPVAAVVGTLQPSSSSDPKKDDWHGSVRENPLLTSPSIGVPVVEGVGVENGSSLERRHLESTEPSHHIAGGGGGNDSQSSNHLSPIVARLFEDGTEVRSAAVNGTSIGSAFEPYAPTLSSESLAAGSNGSSGSGSGGRRSPAASHQTEGSAVSSTKAMEWLGIFSRFDTDGSGTVSVAELEAGLRRYPKLGRALGLPSNVAAGTSTLRCVGDKRE